MKKAKIKQSIKELTVNEQEFYICDKCDERVQGNLLILTDYPQFFRDGHDKRLEKWARDIDVERKTIPEKKLYHRTGTWTKQGHTSWLCGSMHEETQQEFLIHWIGGKLKHVPKQKIAYRCGCEQRY